MTDVKQEIADHNEWMGARMAERRAAGGQKLKGYIRPLPRVGDTWRWEDPVNDFIVSLKVVAFDESSGEVGFTLKSESPVASELLSQLTAVKKGVYHVNIAWTFWEDCYRMQAAPV